MSSSYQDILQAHIFWVIKTVLIYWDQTGNYDTRHVLHSEYFENLHQIIFFEYMVLGFGWNTQLTHAILKYISVTIRILYSRYLLYSLKFAKLCWCFCHFIPLLFEMVLFDTFFNTIRNFNFMEYNSIKCFQGIYT